MVIKLFAVKAIAVFFVSNQMFANVYFCSTRATFSHKRNLWTESKTKSSHDY